MGIKQFGATALLSLCAATTQAATLDFTDSVTIAGLSTTNTALFAPRFDAGLGTLNFVELQLSVTTTLDAGIENLEAAEAAAILTLGNNIFISADDAQQAFVEATPQTILDVMLDANDGATDFSGPSGQSFSAISLTDTAANTLNDASVLTAFTGRGAARFTIEAFNQVDATGASRFAGDFAISSLGITEIDLRVQYDFTPPVAAVPLPAGFALLGLALAGLGFTRRR